MLPIRQFIHRILFLFFFLIPRSFCLNRYEASDLDQITIIFNTICKNA